jgi:hypothetical protein
MFEVRDGVQEILKDNQKRTGDEYWDLILVAVTH